MRIWSLLHAVSLSISSIAAGAVASGIYRHTELRVSAVRFVFFFFFFYLWLWSLFRGIFYIDMFLMDNLTLSDQLQGVDYEYFDSLGLHSVAQIANVTRPWLSFVLVMGDTFLMAASLWMFPMTWELSRLARMSMDRGIARERDVVRWYGKWVHVLVVLFFFVEAGYTIYNRGFNNRSYRVLISGNMLQAITLVYVVYVLFRLKWSGRKYETINGTQVASPLYKRLKSIMYEL
ncbi:hypothetical protein PINS_up019421 [Pythium insidiosum]|nr:hypothetical protein PINS_up019421 [Pythium insidiosum]